MAEHNLGRVVDAFIARVLLIAEAPDDLVIDPAGLRAQLLGDLSALDDATDLHDAQQIDDARFALVAWADETLLKADWAGRDAWSHELLQMRLYRTNRGGDEFFERLARISPDQSGSRYVFFLCLMFGFEGQLVGDVAALRALAGQHFDMLRASGLARDLVATERLSPEAYELEVHLEPPTSGTIRRILFGWALFGAAVFAVAWGILRVMAARVPLPPGS